MLVIEGMKLGNREAINSAMKAFSRFDKQPVATIKGNKAVGSKSGSMFMFYSRDSV